MPDDAESTPLPDGPAAEPEPAPAPAARPPPPGVKPSTFLFTFLFVLGIVMLFDTSTRNGVALELGLVLSPSIGFHGNYPLLTMFVAAVIEMALTAVAYNWATDWFKAAQVQQWGAAFRKVQLAAMRSGKKDRIDALKPHQTRFTNLSSEVSLAQLKGMAVTWFLVIAIYTWVGLFLGDLCQFQADGSCGNPGAVTVTIGGAPLALIGHTGWPIPPWFVLFSLYTVPLSLVFRRLLKHYTLRQHAARSPPTPAPGSEAAGGPA